MLDSLRFFDLYKKSNAANFNLNFLHRIIFSQKEYLSWAAGAIVFQKDSRHSKVGNHL